MGCLDAYGKSDYCNYISEQITGCQFFDLDRLIEVRTGVPASQLLPQIGNDAFFRQCSTIVDELAANEGNGIKLIAVGAGALQSTLALDWVGIHSRHTITIMASPEEVYDRGGGRNCNRSLAQFIADVYSEERKSIYEAAQIQFPVYGLSLEESRSRFNDLILGLQNL